MYGSHGSSANTAWEDIGLWNEGKRMYLNDDILQELEKRITQHLDLISRKMTRLRDLLSL